MKERERAGGRIVVQARFDRTSEDERRRSELSCVPLSHNGSRCIPFTQESVGQSIDQSTTQPASTEPMACLSCLVQFCPVASVQIVDRVAVVERGEGRDGPTVSCADKGRQ